MFSKVLDCPSCNGRFMFEHDNDSGKFPEKITCPQCGASNFTGDYSAINFCPGCRAKLRIPLDIISDPDLSCPQCGISLGDLHTVPGDDDMTTFTGHGADQHQMYRRLLQDGEQFDKYQIIRLLGKGGMAEVYLAEHLLLKQLCALKLMRSSSVNEDPVHVKRFLREAKLSHRFDHPNIVKVFDVGSDHQTGYLFIAMEYVEGKTVLELSRERQLSAGDLTQLTVAMCHALQCLNEAGVVHRDIKPSNIMQNKDGVFKLMDLGIAKSENNHQAGEMTLTMEQTTIGTPSYASPEQCQSAHKVDHRSDIYSLGATLYHAASGKLPFDGETAVETILNVLQREAEPLKNLRSDLPPELLDMIGRMMEKAPENRPGSSAEILALLHGNKKLSAKNIAKRLLKNTPEFLKNQFIPKKSSPRNIILLLGRTIGLIVLITVIALNFKYLMNKGKKAAAPRTQTASAAAVRSLFDGRQPLMSYPEEKLSSSFIYRQGSRAFPVVLLPEKSAPLAGEADFSKNRNIPGFDHRSIINNALKLDGSFPKLKNMIAPDNIARFDLNTLYIHRQPDANNTLELDLNVADNYNGLIARWGSNFIELYAEKNKLALLVDKSYCISTPLEIPCGKWFNITVSADTTRHKLSVLSGDRLIGIWMLPKVKLQPNKVIFYDLKNSGSFHGSIGRIALYSDSVNYTIPDRYKQHPIESSSDHQEFARSLADAKNFQREQRKAEEEAARLRKEAEAAAEKARQEALAEQQKMKAEAAAEKAREEAEKERIAKQNQWQYAPFGQAWHTDYEQAAYQAQDGKPLLVLIVNPNEEKSKKVIEYINKSAKFKSFIEKNFTALYLNCPDSTAAYSSRQREYNQNIRNKLNAANIQLPAYAVQKSFQIPQLQFRHLKAVDTLQVRLESDLAGITLAKEFTDAKLRTIDLRLRECKFLLKNLLPHDNTFLTGKRRDFLQKQIETLTKLQNTTRNIQRAKNRSYSSTSRFKRKLQNYIDGRQHSRSYRERQRDHEELQRMFSSGVDPNVMISVSHNNNRLSGECTLLELVLNNDLPSQQSFLQMLQRRYADPNLIAHKNRVRLISQYNTLAKMGLENIDTVNDNGSVIVPLRRLCTSQSYSESAALYPQPRYNFDKASELLLYAPKVNDLPGGRSTLMHYAAMRNNRRFAEDLIGAGFNEFTALDHDNRSIYETALYYGSKDVVEFLQANKLTGTQVDEKYQRQYDFIRAVMRSDTTLAEKLIKAGADPNQPWWNSFSALANACLENKTQMVKMLLHNGGRSSGNNSFRSNQIDLSLLIAIRQNNSRIFSMLLANGISAGGTTYYQGYQCDLGMAICYHACSREGMVFKAVNFLKILKQYNRSWDVNHEINGKTPLSIVCLHSHNNPHTAYLLAEYLLSIGAKPFTSQYYTLSGTIRDPKLKNLLEKAEKRHDRSVKKRKTRRKNIYR